MNTLSGHDDANELFANILASSIHDAKEALGVIQADLRQLNLLVEEMTDARTLSAQIDFGVERINDNLVGLLTLYKLQHKRYALNIQPHSLTDIVADLQASHANMLQARNIILDNECHDSATGYFDFNLIYGVLSNAMHNAIRYAKQRICISGQLNAENGVEFCVEDDGAGIPNHTENTPEESGFLTGQTGLGLFFAQTVAKAHRNRDRRGDVQLDNHSRLGGARFKLTLP